MVSYLMHIVEININQREEEGVNAAPFRVALANVQKLDIAEQAAALNKLIEDLESAPIQDGLCYTEPNGLDEILKSAAPMPDLPKYTDYSAIRDKILGGWLGRASGCMLGKPIEGTPLGHKKDDVRAYLEGRKIWPISGYFDRDEPACAIDPVLPRPFPGMTRDDDIDYVLLNLLLLEKFGLDWNHKNAREIWCRHLSYDFIYAAGKAAYRNFCLDMLPPKTATWGNSFRQSLGAMIRCDTWGWVSPGNPAKAAGLAYRDAVISQTTNGIYSGMFFAAMIAAAFVESDVMRLIDVGLAYVPASSRFAEAVRFTIDSWSSSPNLDAVLGAVYSRYSEQCFNHCIINACIVLVGLLSGAGDFERTIINTVTCGFDTDCTGATAGSICGVILGASKLPSKWIDPLNDSYETFLAGFGVQKFTNLAARTAVIALEH